jgi:hypothetical protein
MATDSVEVAFLTIVDQSIIDLLPRQVLDQRTSINAVRVLFYNGFSLENNFLVCVLYPHVLR